MKRLSKSFSFFLALVLLMIISTVTAAGPRCSDDSQCRRDVCIRDVCATRSNSGGACSLDSHCFNPATESCINNICTTRSNPGGDCDTEGDCFIVDSTCPSGKCRSPLEPSSMVWEGNLAPLNPSDNTASIVVSNILFVFEGYREGSPLSVEAYDPVAKTWTPMANAPVSCFAHSAVAVGTAIFLIGGLDGIGNHLTTTYMFDPVSNKWETDWPQLPEGRSSTAAAAFGTTLFLFGGQTGSPSGTNTILSLDVSSKTVANAAGWVTRSTVLPATTSSLSATTVGSDIFLTGGADASGVAVKTALKFNANNPDANPVAINSLLQARLGHMSFYDPPRKRLYVVSGIFNSFQNTVEYLDLSVDSSGPWVSANAPNYAQLYSNSGGLIGSRFYFTSGQSLQVLDVNAPSSIKWSPFANSPSPGASIFHMAGATVIAAVDTYNAKTSFSNTALDTWTVGGTFSQFPVPTQNAASALALSGLFVMGGDNNGGTTSDVSVLYVAGWTKQDPLPSARTGGCAVADGATIYFYGGAPNPSSAPVSDLYVMDTTKVKGNGQWSTITPSGATPTAVMNCAAVVVGKKLLIFGGGTAPGGTSPTGLIQSFDIASKTWNSPLSVTITPRSYLSAVFLKGFVFVIGGSVDGGNTALAKVEVFDVIFKTISTIKDMPSPRFSLGSVTDGTFIYSVGGISFGNVAFPSLEKLRAP